MSKLSDLQKNAYQSAGFDDIPVTITAAAFESYHFEPNDYNPEGSDVIQAGITYKSDDDKELKQSYRLGDAKFFQVSKDGASVEVINDGKGLRSDCEFKHFLDELQNSGYPMVELDEDKRGFTAGLVGGRYQIKSEPVLDDEGKPKTHTSKKDGRVYKSTKTQIAKVLTLPWEAKGGKGSTKTSTKKGSTKGESAPASTPATPPAAPAGDFNAAEEVNNLIMGGIGNASDEKPYTKNTLMSDLLKKYAKDADKRKACIAIANSAEQLGGIEGITFDGKTFGLPE